MAYTYPYGSAPKSGKKELAMHCSRCAATKGQFVGGLDQGEWYCRECAADIPDLAISPSRAGVAGSLRVDHAAAPPPQLHMLRRVLPMGQRIDRSEVAITMFSVELFEDGFRVRARIELTPEHPHWMSSNFLDPKESGVGRGRPGNINSGFVARDDLGNDYLCQARLNGMRNRYECDLLGRPAIDTSASVFMLGAEQLIWQDVFRPMDGFVVDDGPWQFTVTMR
jgi:hypothetical protein